MITLGDMAAKGMTMLEVACRRCERRGRLSSIARLIAEHGREDYGDLRALIAADCPRMQNPSVNIRFPDHTPTWTLRPRNVGDCQ
jgi:hypothetical protein